MKQRKPPSTSKTGSNWMLKNGYKQVSLYFDDAQIEKIDRLAKKNYCKRSQLVMGLIVEALGKMK